MRNNSSIRCQRGFTLIELLITLAVSGILMAGVYTAFKSQQDSYLAQEQVAETQQNIRAGLDVMVRDIRMAGYDPDRTGTFGIDTAAVDEFRFTAAAFDGEGNDEDISYRLYPSVSGSSLGRQNRQSPPLVPPPNISAIADNIEELEFLYLDNEGNVTADIDAIRSVQISILARARFPDRNYTHNQFYCPASNPFDPDTGDCLNPVGKKWEFPPDNFRRRFQITTVHLRNMGL